MAIICEFGTAPEQALAGYRMEGIIVGTDASVLAQHEGADARLMRGAQIFGADGEYEFALMTKPNTASTAPAFILSETHIEAVLNAYSLRVANTNGQSFADMAYELLCKIDAERVELAALGAAGDRTQQAQAVMDEIKAILVEDGVLEF